MSCLCCKMHTSDDNIYYNPLKIDEVQLYATKLLVAYKLKYGGNSVHEVEDNDYNRVLIGHSMRYNPNYDQIVVAINQIWTELSKPGVNLIVNSDPHADYPMLDMLELELQILWGRLSGSAGIITASDYFPDRPNQDDLVNVLRLLWSRLGGTIVF